jgi:Cu(I)/Ag(I) efflux system membrane fusion protein
MTRREMRWLTGGLLGGLAIAGISVKALYERPSLTEREVGGHRPPLQQTGAAGETAQPADANAAVQLSDEEQKSIGVETVEVKRQTIRKEIIAPGKVNEPETGIGVISARIGGRIEKLLLNVTGETVSRGQPVALIYSPDVFTAAEEYRLALENRRRLNNSKESEAISEAEALIQASKRRLELWGLTEEQINELAKAPETSVQIATYSSISGVVTKRNVSEGQYVKEGDALYTVTDLSTVWIQADIFESDIPSVRNGQSAKITAPGAGSGTLGGTVSFLQPAVDPQTRTMTARIEVPNPGMHLRPGMFVQLSFETPISSNAVAVPRSAVLNTGKEKVVYIAKDNGVFEKRAIEADAAGDEYYAATKGLEPGERVVTHGNFLIDSQTRLTGSITGMFGGSKAYGGGSAPAQGSASGYTVTMQSETAPPKGGSEGTFHVKVTGPDGKPVSDAQVQMQLLMPAMPSMGMGEMRSTVDFMWNGSEYVGKGVVAMAGPWNVTVEARRNGQLLGVYRSRFDAK